MAKNNRPSARKPVLEGGADMLAMRAQEVAANVERKLTHIWNLNNVFLRMFEKIGVKQGWWSNREEFAAFYKQTADELSAEAKANQAAEFARIKAQQKVGETPEPADIADDFTKLHGVGGGGELERVKADLTEIARLNAEKSEGLRSNS